MGLAACAAVVSGTTLSWVTVTGDLPDLYSQPRVGPNTLSASGISSWRGGVTLAAGIVIALVWALGWGSGSRRCGLGLMISAIAAATVPPCGRQWSTGAAGPTGSLRGCPAPGPERPGLLCAVDAEWPGWFMT